MWGTSSEDLYIVGNNGLLAHHNGQSWTNIESGTERTFYDIWGILTETNNPYILAIANDGNMSQPGKLFNITTVPVSSVHHDIYRNVSSVWFCSPYKIYLSGGGIFSRAQTEYRWREVKELPLVYTYCIRGTAANNIWAVGDYGLIAHFNGKTWKQVSGELESDFSYRGLTVKDNIAVAVGRKGSQAIITKITLHN
jgi:hypothetical protein